MHAIDPSQLEIAGFIMKAQQHLASMWLTERDSTVDSLTDQIFREFLTYMMQDPGNIMRAVHLILISRHLERIADHSTNIAEEVVYIVKAKVVKHRGYNLEEI